MAAGALRGDELNSILEASPRLARLLTDSLGRPIGDIKKLGEAGELTSDKLLAALTNTKFTAAIDAEFRELPTTFSDAIQAVENAAINVFGAFDSGGQFSNALVNFLAEGTDTFAGLERAAENLGIEIRSTLDGLRDAFEPMLEGGNSAFDQLGIRIYSMKEQISSLLHSFDDAQNFLPDLQRWAQRKDEEFFGFRTGPYTGEAAPRANAGGRYDQTQRFREQILKGDAILRRFDAQFPLDRATGGVKAPAPVSPRPAPAVGTTRKTGRSKAEPRSPLDPEAFAREEARINQDILRGRIDAAQTAEEVANLELQRLALAKETFDRELAADKRLTEPEKARLALTSELAASIDRAAVIRKRDIEVERRASDAVQRTYDTADAAGRNAIDEARAKAALAITAGDRRDAELRILDLVHAQERAEQERLINLRRRVLADKNATPDARADAEAAIARAEARLATLNVTQGSERRLTAEQNLPPMAAYLKELRDGAAATNEALEQVEVNGLRSLEDGLTDAITGVRSLGDAFKSMANQVIADLIRIAVRQAIVKPLANSLFGGSSDSWYNPGGSSGGDLGGIIRTIGSAFGGARAMGGPVSAGKAYLVGERGPELFRPVSSGAIVPNHAMNAVAMQPRGGDRHFHISVDARNSVTPQGFAENIGRVILSQAAEMDRASSAATLKAVPARVGAYQKYGM